MEDWTCFFRSIEKIEACTVSFYKLDLDLAQLGNGSDQ